MPYLHHCTISFLALVQIMSGKKPLTFDQHLSADCISSVSCLLLSRATASTWNRPHPLLFRPAGTLTVRCRSSRSTTPQARTSSAPTTASGRRCSATSPSSARWGRDAVRSIDWWLCGRILTVLNESLQVIDCLHPSQVLSSAVATSAIAELSAGGALMLPATQQAINRKSAPLLHNTWNCNWVQIQRRGKYFVNRDHFVLLFPLKKHYDTCLLFSLLFCSFHIVSSMYHVREFHGLIGFHPMGK